MKDIDLIEKLTLQNAIKYNGKASSKSTLGSVIRTDPVAFKSRIQETKVLVEKMVEKVNALTLEQQKSRLSEISPESLIQDKKRKKEINIELPPNPDFAQTVLRLAPYPSGPLHIGNSRMVVLNDYCAKKYDGKLLLVYDDTIGSDTKIIDPSAYDSILEGLDYLGVTIHETYYKSDRLDLFYRYSREIISKGEAYVCTCAADIWRNRYKEQKKSCPCRPHSIEENLDNWEKMLGGGYQEKGAVVRLKSGMALADPAIRDPALLRISEREHPRVGTKYRVWPLLEYSWGIDDHDLGISHIIRGKDLRKEGIIEQMIWKVFGWKEPAILLYGRMKLKGLRLSKSLTAKSVRDGTYFDWTDPRTWSLQSLERRGIQKDAIHNALLKVGLSSVDVTFSPEAIYSANRKLIDSTSNRYFFVPDPIKLMITDVPSFIKAAQPLKHPEHPEIGRREIKIDIENGCVNIYVPKQELLRLGDKKIIRLKDLMNITITRHKEEMTLGRYESKGVQDAREMNAPMTQWVPVNTALPTEILLPDGNIMIGVSEPDLRKVTPGNIIQFERVAFCRVEELGSPIRMIFVHR
ncbi:MAG: glutamate--tRNA ligase [Candidatus Heimdallarchaeota archaeon]